MASIKPNSKGPSSKGSHIRGGGFTPTPGPAKRIPFEGYDDSRPRRADLNQTFKG